MDSPKNSDGRIGGVPQHQRLQNSGGQSEWDADTDVMPPEYCRQLLKISRQLEQEG
jgi:hypothetical protein